MQIFKKNFTLICLALTSVILFVTSCSSTRTQESTDQYIQSSTITAKVKSALLADTTVNALQVNVKTYKDVVQLSGFVNSQREKQKAVAIARHVPGVAAVKDSLVVKPTIRHSN